MVALNLLAASLLVAGVGGSLGLPSPRNVDVLPAVGSLQTSTAFGLISPVAEVVSFDGDTADGLDLNLHLGSYVLADKNIGNGYFLLTFDGESLTAQNYLAADMQDNAFVYVSVDSDGDVYLPDVSLWDTPDDYELCAYFCNNPEFVGGYYGCFNGVLDGELIEIAPMVPLELGVDVNPIDAITDGLTAIAPLGGALTNGFDAVFMDDGALTAVGMFAFILMGVGISVGITKKCFNWVTGRHGM